MKFFLYFCALFCSAWLQACPKPLIVGTNPNWPPYSYLEDEELQGLDIDITKRIFSRANLCIKFRVLPSSSRGFVELRKGNIDVLKAASYTEARAQFATFTLPYRQENMVLFGRKTAQIQVKSLSDLFEQRMTFAAGRGGYFGEAFQRLQKAFPDQVSWLPTSKQRFGLLDKGRVSFVIDDELTGKHYIDEVGLSDLASTGFVVHANPVHFMVGKEVLSKVKLEQLNQVIVDAKTEIDLLLKGF